jgi:hypothetical protein
LAEYQVLHQEPRHRVDEFVDEVVERRKATIDAMRPALESLVRNFCDQFESLKQAAPALHMRGVVFAETKWSKEGRLVVEFGYDPQKDHDLGPRYHVDELVREIVEKNGKLVVLFDELSQFVGMMVDQFMLLKKTHLAIDLTAITFDDMRWLNQALIFDINLHGKPFVPREARWA